MLFTIGHSTHAIETFLERLKTHRINCVIDARSHPFSKIAPQFNKPALSKTLVENGILYAHLPDEFGARRTEKNFLDEEGKVDFEKVRESEAFKRGVERVKNGLAQGYRIAIMCAEADPLDCHRFSMVARGFALAGENVQHVLKDGSLRSHEALEERLLEKYKLSEATLFSTREERLSIAYRLRNKDIAFSSLHLDEALSK